MRVPAGRYVSGSLVLKSHTTLHLEAGAVLLGSSNRNDYPIVQARWEGNETNCHRALISADQAENIASESQLTGGDRDGGIAVITAVEDQGPGLG